MKKVLIFMIVLFFGHDAYSQLSFGKKAKEITIESPIQCGMCEDRLDNMFAEFWAVKNVEYDLEEQTITVKYNPKKTNPEEIREAIAATGYDADEIEADEQAYNGLPACCQKGGHHSE